MITFNSKVNFNTIKEKDILTEIKKREAELLQYGMSHTEIKSVLNNSYEIDLCSCEVEKILLSISICELLWYNKIYQKYTKYKDSLHKLFIFDNTIKLNTLVEESYRNKFLSTLTLIVQKYGKEFLD